MRIITATPVLLIALTMLVQVSCGNNNVKSDNGSYGNSATNPILSTTSQPMPTQKPDTQKSATAAPVVPSGYGSLGSQHFRLFVAQTGLRDNLRNVEMTLRVLEAARNELMPQLTAAGCRFDAAAQVRVIVYASTGDFVAATGWPAWAAATTNGNVLQTQPLATLQKRRVLVSTLRHEYAHAALNLCTPSGKTSPRWLQEGLAIRFAGESAILTNDANSNNIKGLAKDLTLDELEQQLDAPPDPDAMRRLYAQAYRQTQETIVRHGATAVWRWACGGQSPQISKK